MDREADRSSGSGSQTCVQARLIPTRSVLVNDSLARHPIDQRDGLLERAARARQIVAGNRRPHVLQRGTQPGSELTIVLAVLQTLTMRLQRGFVRSHLIFYLRNP